jgi:hypothetical protein
MYLVLDAEVIYQQMQYEKKKHRDDCKFHVADRLAASFVINVISAMASVSEATNFTNGVFIHIFIL